MIISKKTIGNTGYAVPNSKPKLDPSQNMEITVTRNPSKDGATIGTMRIDGNWICYTLEDIVREVAGQPVSTWKVKNETAIPRGRYAVIKHFSPHFDCEVPMLVGVEGFSLVYFHWGNFAKDTEGCILVGFTITNTNTIGASKAAFVELFSQIEEALKAGQKVWCTVA
jgi:hypothetical protein